MLAKKMTAGALPIGRRTIAFTRWSLWICHRSGLSFFFFLLKSMCARLHSADQSNFIMAPMPMRSWAALGRICCHGRFSAGGFAASWLFSSRRQALDLLEHPICVFALPNVRAKGAPTVGRQARAGENVQRTTGPGLVARRWCSL